MVCVSKGNWGFPVILGADTMRELKIGISFDKEKINVKSRNEKERGIGDSEWILEIKENFIPVKKRKIREDTLHASNEINIEKKLLRDDKSENKARRRNRGRN